MRWCSADVGVGESEIGSKLVDAEVIYDCCQCSTQWGLGLPHEWVEGCKLRALGWRLVWSCCWVISKYSM